MEKAKFNILKSKSGKPVVEIVFQDGKKIPFSQKLNHPSLLSLNGKEIEVERVKGQIVRIVCDGKEIFSQSQKKDTPSHFKQRHTSPSGDSTGIGKDIYSTAPYNFIPLNEKVVEAPEVPDFDRYHKDRHTGYIEVEIEALTPLYIRDTLTPEEYRAKIELEKQNSTHPKTYINPDFFSPGGLIRIPGSSLRGMIRTLVEIVSYGKFEFFERKRLYFRGLADRCKSLRQEYQNKTKDVKAGILFKSGLDYYIIPTKYRPISNEDARKIISKKGYKYENFRNYKVEGGYIVVSGPIGGKKRDWFVEIPPADSKKIKISKLDIESYKNDTNRSSQVPDLLSPPKEGMPCFFTEYIDSKNNKRIAFGHTRFFRLPYEKTVDDFVSDKLKNEEKIDLAEAIFGKETSHASRVFFEDLLIAKENENVLYDVEIPKILSGPKPTCFQHYLEQRKENLKDHPRNLAHYNSNTKIRGYKLYWHKNSEEWREVELSYDKEKFDDFLKAYSLKQENLIHYIDESSKQAEKSEKKVKIRLSELPEDLKAKFIESIGIYESQHTKITPVKEGTVFRGRIRFENLSDVELGALLFVLNLPDGLAHKLGMGKPLGLGSVRIKTKLYKLDREKRYKELFCEWDSLNHEESSTDEFKEAFKNYVLSSLKEKLDSLWDLDRMKELRIMLNFAKKPDDVKTKYMDLNEFRERKVLPKPSEIVKP